MECLICKQRKIPQGSCSVCKTRNYEICLFCKREDPQRPRLYSAGLTKICDECICEKYHRPTDAENVQVCNFCSKQDSDGNFEQAMICRNCTRIAHDAMQTSGKHCSFCGVFFEDVEHLITGPVNICNRCFKHHKSASDLKSSNCTYCGSTVGAADCELVQQTPLCHECVTLCSEIFSENVET